MAIITHGSDLTLAPTLRPMAQAVGGDPRKGISAVRDAGFHAVQLDATMPGLRPRELNRSARRDLAATLRRASLSPAGIDFLIPAEHYTDPTHMDRAVEAAHAALTLAADLGRLPLTLNLPVLEADEQATADLLTAADGLGVAIALMPAGDPNGVLTWLADQDSGIVGFALDPASLLAARHDPVGIAQQAGQRLKAARLADAQRGQADGSRRAVGQGDLPVSAYRVTVDLAPQRAGPVVLDLRGLSDPIQAARQGAAAWQDAAMQL